MITTKQRSILRALANTLEPTMQIGKDGLSDNSLVQISQMLEAKELIKIKLLQNSDFSAREMSNKICEKVLAEPVQVIGRIMVLYKRSTRKDIKNIQLPN